MTVYEELISLADTHESIAIEYGDRVAEAQARSGYTSGEEYMLNHHKHTASVLRIAASALPRDIAESWV